MIIHGHIQSVVCMCVCLCVCVCVCVNMDSGRNADESYLEIHLADLEHVDDVPGQLGYIKNQA